MCAGPTVCPGRERESSMWNAQACVSLSHWVRSPFPASVCSSVKWGYTHPPLLGGDPVLMKPLPGAPDNRQTETRLVQMNFTEPSLAGQVFQPPAVLQVLEPVSVVGPAAGDLSGGL